MPHHYRAGGNFYKIEQNKTGLGKTSTLLDPRKFSYSILSFSTLFLWNILFLLQDPDYCILNTLYNGSMYNLHFLLICLIKMLATTLVRQLSDGWSAVLYIKSLRVPFLSGHIPGLCVPSPVGVHVGSNQLLYSLTLMCLFSSPPLSLKSINISSSED